MFLQPRVVCIVKSNIYSQLNFADLKKLDKYFNLFRFQSRISFITTPCRLEKAQNIIFSSFSISNSTASAINMSSAGMCRYRIFLLTLSWQHFCVKNNVQRFSTLSYMPRRQLYRVFKYFQNIFNQGPDRSERANNPKFFFQHYNISLVHVIRISLHNGSEC